MKNELQNFFSTILLYAGTVFVHNCPLLLSVNVLNAFNHSIQAKLSPLPAKFHSH